MTTQQHTPGPWLHNGRNGKPQTAPSNGWSIVGPDGRGITACASSISRSNEEKFANARLIAAAPDMLAACQEVLRCAALPDEWAAPIRAAIAKATA